MSSKRGNQRRPAQTVAQPSKKLTKEEAAVEEAAHQKRVDESIAADREKEKYWWDEAAFLASGDNTF